MTNMEDVVMAAKVRLLQFINPNVCKEQLSSMPSSMWQSLYLAVQCWHLSWVLIECKLLAGTGHCSPVYYLLP